MKLRLTTKLWLFGIATLAQAHFVFVVPEPGSARAKVFISEDLEPDGQVDFGLAGGAKLVLRDDAGRETPLTLVKGSDAYLITIAGRGPRVVYGDVDLGFSQSESSAKPFLLAYHPKTIIGMPFDAAGAIGRTPVEIVPSGKAGNIRLMLLANGKPLADSEITLIQPDGKQKKVKTGQDGQTEVLGQTGRYGAWARFWETSPGEREGKKYVEIHHYATLVFDTANAVKSTAKAVAFATLPESAASFGAVLDDGWLYVYGGHVSQTHAYSTDAVSGQFHRMRLSTPGTWESLPSGPALQGTNLVAYKNRIYRIGGMEPRNEPGKPVENYSTAESARFDPRTGLWEELPPLPEPRSSHDLVVIGDKLIVTGGWAMQGKAGQKWMTTLEVLDLAAQKLEWKPLAQPFARRALIAAAYSGKMYVMGGITEKEAIVPDVDIYDPRTDTWTKGPPLPGSGVNPFAPAATVHEGALYVSVADGNLYRLNVGKQQWEESGRATPRVAHRLVSTGKAILVIGGAANGKNFDLIEALPIAPE